MQIEHKAVNSVARHHPYCFVSAATYLHLLKIEQVHSVGTLDASLKYKQGQSVG